MKWATCLTASLLLISGVAAAEGPQQVRISRFSGKPVPRFETLRYAEVNGRAGPSKAYPVIWQYDRKGLPVLIIKESEDWRRVRDPSGDEVWVHERMLSSDRQVLVQTASQLRAGEAEETPVVAQVGAGVLAGLKGCRAAFCQIEAGGYSGWVPKAHLWGTDPGEASL